MLQYVIATLAAASGWTAYRSSRSRPRPLLVTVLALLAAFCLFAEAGHRQSEARWSAAAQHLTGRPEAVVKCQRISAGLLSTGVMRGWVQFDGNGQASNVANLDWQTCHDLRSWERNRRDATREEIAAVHVLTHEAIHLTGVMDEAVTECTAIQHDETTATLLGADTALAQTIPVRYYAEHYPYMPEGYRSGDCVQDGLLDQSPQDGAWPGSAPTDQPTDQAATVAATP